MRGTAPLPGGLSGIMSENSSIIRFSKGQSRLVTCALAVLAFTIVFLFVWAVLRVVSAFISAHSAVLVPPIAALFLAMILRPAHLWLQQRIWPSPAGSLCLLLALLFLPIAAFCYFFGNWLVSQVILLAHALPNIRGWLSETASDSFPALMEFLREYGWLDHFSSMDPGRLINADTVLQLFGAATSGVGGATVAIGSWISGFMGSLFGWASLPIYTALLLLMRPFSGRDLDAVLIFFSPRTQRNVVFLVDQFLDIVYSFFRGQVLVALLQGVFFAVGFLLVGLPYGFLIGLVLGLLNIVPYLGNILGLSVALPLAYFTPGGGLKLLALVVLVFCAVQTLDSYFITPRVMGKRTGLNAFAVIFSLFFWNSVLGGVLGMLLAIPLSAFFVVFFRLLRREYFPGPEGGADSPNAASDAPAPPRLPPDGPPAA